MRPIRFMIMPYGKKATQAEAGHGVGIIDVDALWDRAYAPVIMRPNHTTLYEDT